MILDWSILLDLLPNPWLFPALLFMPVVARLMMVTAISSFPYARPEGMGKAFKDGGTKPVLCGAFFYTIILMLVPGIVMALFGVAPLGAGGLFAWFPAMAAVLLSALVFTLFFASYATRHLGGLTGDLYGAVTTLTETLVLFVFLLISAFVC